MWELLLLLVLSAVGLTSGNDAVGLAALLALFVRELGPPGSLEATARHSTELGVLFLVLGLLLPAVSGAVRAPELFSRVLLTPTGLLSLAVGLIASRLAADGVALMQARPEVLMGLVAGSLAGVWLLGGFRLARWWRPAWWRCSPGSFEPQERRNGIICGRCQLLLFLLTNTPCFHIMRMDWKR